MKKEKKTPLSDQLQNPIGKILETEAISIPVT